jgi:hypothetical protein
MNSPRDPWADFAEVFADEMKVQPLTDAQLEALREEYERAQIDSAQSEAAMAANIKEYAK